MKHYLASIACVLAVVAAIPPKRVAPDECRLAEENERCSGIFEKAVKGEAWRGGLKSGLQHYCREIVDFVPCLEEDKAVYVALYTCQEELYMREFPFEKVMTLDEMWNTSIDFLATVNDIICTRTDEIIELVECIKIKDRTQFQPLLGMCAGQHFGSLLTTLRDETVINDPHMVCSSISGFASCLKTGLTRMCGTEVSDLLDTVYDDVIDGVIGKALDCEVTNPLLDFVRTVRNKYKK